MTCALCGTEIVKVNVVVINQQHCFHQACVSLCKARGRECSANTVVDLVMKGAPTFGQRDYIEGLDRAHPGMGPIAEKILSTEGPDDAAGY